MTLENIIDAVLVIAFIGTVWAVAYSANEQLKAARKDYEEYWNSLSDEEKRLHEIIRRASRGL